MVGRDSTALLELIKNAYDADASVVTVHAEGLDSSTDALLTVSDDGNGMTFERFQHAFLRIAGRDKEGERLSPRFKRRYTGAKGIGRLAAQKLAGRLDIDSVPRSEAIRGLESDSPTGVKATLAWDEMENHSDLNDLGDSLTAERVPIRSSARRGTTLVMSEVTDLWAPRRLGPFIREIRACRPAGIFVERLPKSVTTERLLFDVPQSREHGPNDPGFKLDLTGQFEGGDDLWPTLSARTSWIIEIDATPELVRYCILPTVKYRKSLAAPAKPAWARRYDFEGPHPEGAAGPSFHCRILVSPGSVGRRQSELARFSGAESGIRVYLEGFRVLPYGSPGDDWLRLDLDYARRPREFETDVSPDALPVIKNEGFSQLGNRAYYGAVMLTERGAPELQPLVNREGFIPDDYFESIRTVVRTGVDLSVRVRAALKKRIDAAERESNRQANERQENWRQENERPQNEDDCNPDQNDDVELPPPSPTNEQPGMPGPETVDSDEHDHTSSAIFRRIDSTLLELIEIISELRAEFAEPNTHPKLDILTNNLRALQIDLADVRDEQLTLRTLAGVGTQFTAFVHEINGLLGQSQSLRSILGKLADSGEVKSREGRRTLKAARDSSDDLVQSLTRQMSYLTDVVGPDSRRRRRRLLVHDRVESAIRLLLPRITERQQSVENLVDVALTSPPIFPAEASILLINLLTNAVKFAGDSGKIRVTAFLDKEMAMHLRVENSGVEVPRKDWARYFRPFESSTVSVDIVLGQGMGLGLPIVRSLAADYDGSANFVEPNSGFATAVEVVIPDPRPGIARKSLSRQSQSGKGNS